MRLLSLAGRLGFAVTLALGALAASRWAPIDAQAPLDVRTLPLAGPALGFAVLAALAGRERPPRPWRQVLAGLVAALVALAAVVALRGPSSGKNNTAVPNEIPHTCVTFDTPMMPEQSSVVTNAAMMRS